MNTLFDQWAEVWNGNYDLAAAVVTPEFQMHAAMMAGGDGSAVSGPDGLTAWIAQTRAAFSELDFTVEVGPIVDGAYAVGRWVATGVYGGGFPGATAAPGTPIRFTGTDILRMEDGLYAEYWVNSDIHVLLGQLGVHV